MAQQVPSDQFTETWVPVERRWFGLDRRTIVPAVVSVLLVIVLTSVMPAIDRGIKYDRETKAGDVINLGSGVTVVPPPGWGFPDGLLTTDALTSGAEDVTHLSATIENGAMTVTVTTGPFTGSASELLDNINRVNDAYKKIDNSKAKGEVGTITTSSGIAGVGQAFAGINVEGMIAAFVIDGIGVEFVITGPPGTVVDNAETLAKMIDSLAYTKPEAK